MITPSNGSSGSEDALHRHFLDALLTSTTDRIYFKDRESRFIKVNHALALFFGLHDASEAIGKTDADFFGEEHAKDAYEDEQRVMSTGEPIIGKEEKENWRDGHLTWASSAKVPLRDHDGNIIGIIGISRDITDRKIAEAEQERIFHELQEALVNIKTLKGLMPICASCKKIRDDKGYWSEVESYIEKRSDASFSHSICPDCTVKLYPEIQDMT